MFMSQYKLNVCFNMPTKYITMSNCKSIAETPVQDFVMNYTQVLNVFYLNDHDKWNEYT